MNKTQALAIGRAACHIYKGSASTSDWILVTPWKACDPIGPGITTDGGYYRDAKRKLALAVADVAMEQMLEGEEKDVIQAAYFAMMCANENNHLSLNAKALLNIGLSVAQDYKDDMMTSDAD